MSRARDRNARTTVVFDLGGVLIDWNPRYLYRSIFDDDDQVEWFLREVCPPAWNEAQDRGRSFDDAIAEATRRHPDQALAIAAYFHRWPEMLGGAKADVVAILDRLVDAGVSCFALTNWSAETWPFAVERYPFLARFDGIVVSGVEGMGKPDPALYRVLCERFAIDPATAVFIDDRADNTATARALGFLGIDFVGARALDLRLRALGL